MVMDPGLNGMEQLILVIAGLALAASAFASLRNPPEALRRMAREALDRSVHIQTSNEAFKAEVTAILGAVQDERERTLKAQMRSRASEQRAQENNAPRAPASRDEILMDLRRQAGIS
jgi:hypothetical protein